MAGMTYKTNNGFIMEETFKTKGTCATTIQFTRDGDIIRNIRFTGGCNSETPVAESRPLAQTSSPVPFSGCKLNFLREGEK